MFLTRTNEKTKELISKFLKNEETSVFLNLLEERKYSVVFHYDESLERLIYLAYWNDYSSLPSASSIQITILPNGLPLQGKYPLSPEEEALYVYLHNLENEFNAKNPLILKQTYGKFYETIENVPSLDDDGIAQRSRIREEFKDIFLDNEERKENIIPKNGKWDVFVRINKSPDGYLLSLELWDGEEKKMPVGSLFDFLENYSEERSFEYRSLSYSLEHVYFTENALHLLNYLENIAYLSNAFANKEILLSEEQFGNIIEFLLGENMYYQGNAYYVMKNVSKAGYKYKKNGDIELIPPIDDQIHYSFFVFRKGLVHFDHASNVISLYRFTSPSSRKMFSFFLKHGFEDCSLVKDLFQKKLSLPDEAIDPNQPLTISLYVDISDKGALSFKTEYSLYDRKIEKKEAMLNQKFASEINLYLAALLDVGGLEEGVQEEQKAALKFLQGDLSLLKKRSKVYLSNKLSRSKIKHIGGISLNIERHEDWLSLKVKTREFDKNSLALILDAYKQKKKYILLNDDIILLDDPVLAELSELKQKEKLNDDFSKKHLSFSDGYRLQSEYSEGPLKLNVDSSFKEAILEIKNFKKAKVALPSKIEEVLRPYQKVGVQWLSILHKNHLGGILADDMGLGKTLEMISFLSSLNVNKPSLIISPKSVIYNWEKEFKQWNDEINVIVIDGSKDKRNELISSIENDKKTIYITSYDSLRNDLANYSNKNFEILVTDEAQLIKNYSALKSKAVRNIHSSSRFALTGTPIENSMGDLWSIFDFLMPGYLSTYGVFKVRYILAGNQDEARSSLRKRITPFLLRRSKKEVLKELPKKTETVLSLTMDEESRLLYDSTLAKAKIDLKNKKENKDRFSSFNYLPTLTSLREICVDPAAFFEGFATLSVKLAYVTDYAKRSIEGRHKLLIFSSFTKVLDHLGDELKKNGIASYYIHGDVTAKKRLELSSSFNKNDDVQVMLVSLKAGGTGLNLAGADIVIHLDPWWNIASEEQATDRAYRLGQRRPVSVFKLICHDSIEEKVLLLQKNKKELYDSIIRSGEKGIASLSEEDLEYLLS